MTNSAIEVARASADATNRSNNIGDLVAIAS